LQIRPIGAKLFDAVRKTDGRTDRHEEVNSQFSKHCKRASNAIPTVFYPVLNIKSHIIN